MPSFAFWKKFKSVTGSSVLSDAAVAKELRAIIPSSPEKAELDFEDHDSGIFMFDEDAEEFSVPSLISHVLATAESTPLILPTSSSRIHKAMSNLELNTEVLTVEASPLDSGDSLLSTQTSPLIPESTTTYDPPTEETRPNLLQDADIPTHSLVDTMCLPQSPLATSPIKPKVDGNESAVQYPPHGLSSLPRPPSDITSTPESQTHNRGRSRDSGVYMCDPTDAK
jgi:hypothetical protein